MTTGEYLVSHSTLPSGTALQHLLALQIGSGSGETVFASQFVTSFETHRVEFLCKTRSLDSPIVEILAPTAEASGDGKQLFCGVSAGRMTVTVSENEMITRIGTQQTLITRKFEQVQYTQKGA